MAMLLPTIRGHVVCTQRRNVNMCAPPPNVNMPVPVQVAACASDLEPKQVTTKELHDLVTAAVARPAPGLLRVSRAPRQRCHRAAQWIQRMHVCAHAHVHVRAAFHGLSCCASHLLSLQGRIGEGEGRGRLQEWAFCAHN